MDRRTLDVKIASLGVGADQAVEIARLELVGVLRQRFEVADAVVAGAGFENIAEGERAQRRVAAGAAAGDHQAVAVDFAAFGQIARAVDAIVDVDDAPLAVEPFAIRAAVAGAAAVVHVEHGDAAAGPVLNRNLSDAELGDVGPPWLITSSGGFSFVGRSVIAILRRVEKAVSGQAVLGRETRSPRASER